MRCPLLRCLPSSCLLWGCIPSAPRILSPFTLPTSSPCLPALCWFSMIPSSCFPSFCLPSFCISFILSPLILSRVIFFLLILFPIILPPTHHLVPQHLVSRHLPLPCLPPFCFPPSLSPTPGHRLVFHHFVSHILVSNHIVLSWNYFPSPPVTFLSPARLSSLCLPPVLFYRILSPSHHLGCRTLSPIILSPIILFLTSLCPLISSPTIFSLIFFCFPWCLF